MTGDTMLVALKNWRSRLYDAEHSGDPAVATVVDLALNAKTSVDCDDALKQLHAVLADRLTWWNDQRMAGLGPPFSDSTALTAADSRDILDSAMHGLRVEGGR
jgi:hypothetical protein